MGLWVAILITLAVFGSILWVKPSPRERLLTEFRRTALIKGLKVRLLDEKLAGQLFPWIDNYRQFVFYEKALPSSAKPNSNKPIVVRLSDDPNAHEIDAIDPIKKAIADSIDFEKLPNTAEAIVISVSGISLLWRECRGSQDEQLNPVELIDQFLSDAVLLSKIWV